MKTGKKKVFLLVCEVVLGWIVLRVGSLSIKVQVYMVYHRHRTNHVNDDCVIIYPVIFVYDFILRATGSFPLR